MANSSLFRPPARPKGRFHQARRLKEHLPPNTFRPTFFRPISDHFRPCLKCLETKGFATFGAKFSDLKMVGRNSRFFLQNALPFCIFAHVTTKHAEKQATPRPTTHGGSIQRRCFHSTKSHHLHRQLYTIGKQKGISDGTPNGTIRHFLMQCFRYFRTFYNFAQSIDNY